jgi:hypothetical protein
MVKAEAADIFFGREDASSLGAASWVLRGLRKFRRLGRRRRAFRFRF